jgi:glycosyl transferase family 2/flagellin-like protein
MQSSPSSPPPVDHAALAESWRARVDDLTARAVAALSAGEHERLPALFAEIDTWSDAQRAYQGRCRLADAVLAYRPPRPQQWIPAFMTAARCLLDVLAREPREPVLLNSTGILLYELMEAAAAEQLFRAAHRLDPDLAHVRQNLEAARRSRSTTPSLPAPFGASMRVLAKRARAVAGQARPVDGLTLSLCMIVKDEEEMLPGCLSAVRDVVDEMVVVDTGSSDATVQIARSFGAKVIEFPWNGSFADARNISLDNATGDWVMYLDADEHLMEEDAAQLRDVLRRTWREAFYLVETNFTGGEDSGAAVTHHALRLWRHRPQYRFEGRIHEQKTHTMPTYLPERFETTAVRMKHYGYLRSRIAAKDKSKRNIELLEIEAREAPSPFNDYNLANYQENLTSAESRIRDVDMASEMVTFTKLSILQQAGTSMLAQANQSSQSVLSLLR